MSNPSEFTRDDFETWAERNNLGVHEQDDGTLIATWHDGREVHFEPNGNVILRQFNVLGGCEDDDTITVDDDDLVINTYDDNEYRVNVEDFPIDQW